MSRRPIYSACWPANLSRHKGGQSITNMYDDEWHMTQTDARYTAQRRTRRISGDDDEIAYFTVR